MHGLCASDDTVGGTAVMYRLYWNAVRSPWLTCTITARVGVLLAFIYRTFHESL